MHHPDEEVNNLINKHWDRIQFYGQKATNSQFAELFEQWSVRTEALICCRQTLERLLEIETIHNRDQIAAALETVRKALPVPSKTHS